MKIGMITFSRSRNYGAVLQTYATYNYLSNLGNKVEIIDYVPKRYDFRKQNIPYLLRGTKWNKNFVTRFLWKNVVYKNLRKNHKLFWEFISNKTNLTSSIYNENDLSIFENSYDVVISGSDQIWNSDFTDDKMPEKPFFLSFVGDKTKKYSYSSSFGKSELSVDEEATVLNLLSRYDYITTRENTGLSIIKNLGLDGKVILDPTLISGSELWNTMCSDRIIKEKYMLFFQIFPNSNRLEKCKKIAEKKGLKLFVIVPNINDKYRIKGTNVIVLPTVEDWLSYFKYADFIVTDSFHATAFSIMFERQFLVDSNVTYNNRMATLLGNLNLENKMCNLLKEDSFEFDSIDYSIVSPKLNSIREDSKEIIKKMLEL